MPVHNAKGREGISQCNSRSSGLHIKTSASAEIPEFNDRLVEQADRSHD